MHHQCSPVKWVRTFSPRMEGNIQDMMMKTTSSTDGSVFFFLIFRHLERSSWECSPSSFPSPWLCPPLEASTVTCSPPPGECHLQVTSVLLHHDCCSGPVRCVCPQVVFLRSQRRSPAESAGHDPLQEAHAHSCSAGLRTYSFTSVGFQIHQSVVSGQI